MQAPSVVRENPNATVSALAGVPGGELILQISAWAHFTITPFAAMFVATACSWLALMGGKAAGAVMHRGVKACLAGCGPRRVWRRIWEGPEKT